MIAAPATPQSLDCNFDVSLGTFEAIAVLYDNLLEFKKIPDPKQPGAFREDTADHPDLPAGLAIQGKLAELFELDPGGKFIRFQLRQGIKSNWGNELTAEDVKWTWDRKFALGALGAFFLSTLGLENKDGVKVEGKYTVSINLDNPNPLLAKLQPNLYNPIYDLTKCKQESNADDPWARKFLENNSAGFGPLPARPAPTRAAGGLQGEGRLLPRQTGDGHGHLPRGADFSDPQPRYCKAAPWTLLNTFSRWRSSNCAARKAWRSTASTRRS